MRLCRAVVVAIALLSVGACGLPSASEFASGPAKPSDVVEAGRPTDGATTTADTGAVDSGGAQSEGGSDAGSDADASSITNLLTRNRSDFEQGCDLDSAHYLATLAPSSTARTGAKSCEVCRESASVDIWSIDNVFAGTPAAGQEYHATTWVRRAPGITDSFSVRLTVRSRDDQDNIADYVESPPLSVTDEWQPLAVTITLSSTKPATILDTYVWGMNSPSLANPCFLVDDYAVWRTK